MPLPTTIKKTYYTARAELQQSFGGGPEGDVEYYVAQRKQLQSILMTRP